MSAIESAIKLAGSQSNLAAELGVSQPTVSEWVTGARPVPLAQCPAIERFTGVPCEALRPDTAWHRVKDRDWKWNPQGRPLLDISREVV